MKYLDVSEQLAVERIGKAVEAFVIVGNVPRESAASMKGGAKAVRLWTEIGKHERAVAVARQIERAIGSQGGEDAAAAVEVIARSIRTLEKSVA